MVPYFLSAGVHLVRDLTAARDAPDARHPGVEFLLGPPLGPHPLLEQLVAERIRSWRRRAAGRPGLGRRDGGAICPDRGSLGKMRDGRGGEH